MDSRYLQTFMLVVELGSIAEAARRLDLTAATVAQRLKALEASVGSRLIVRAGRTVKPTVAGSRILPRAQVVLREVRDLKSAASDTALPAGPLHMGATPTAMFDIVPRVLKAWVGAHPDIAVYIEPGTTTHLYERVLAAELDAAVLVHPVFDLPKSTGWHLLRQEPLVLLTPARMRVKDPLLTAAREPYIRYDRQVVAGKMADDYLRAHGIRPKLRFELDGIENIARLVAEDLGVSIVPACPALGPLQARIRQWPLPEPCPVREVGVLWSRSSVRAPLVERFVGLASSQERKQA